MGTDFNILLLEGIFYLGPNLYPDSVGNTGRGFRDLWVQEAEGHPHSVYDALEPFLDKQVVFSAHHLPTTPINPALWGGGSCLWEGKGDCPFGHHKHPTRLFNQSGEGYLVNNLVIDPGGQTAAGGWWLEKFDGMTERLFFDDAMVGHRGRIAVAEMLSVEQMRDVVAKAGSMGSVEGLGAKASELRDLMERLSQIKGGDDG